MYVKFKIIKADGHALDADSDVAPVNKFLHSMFNSVDLYLNNKLISSNSDTYPYRAYIENLLSYNADSKSTFLNASVLWVEDTAAQFDTLNHDGANTGLQKRIAIISQSKIQNFLDVYILIYFNKKNIYQTELKSDLD